MLIRKPQRRLFFQQRPNTSSRNGEAIFWRADWSVGADFIPLDVQSGTKVHSSQSGSTDPSFGI